MTGIENKQRITTRQGLGYGVGALGSGIFNTVPSLLLLFYLTNIIGLPPALAGSAVLVPKIWIVVIDPMIGHWSDRTHSRWGRRRPFMFAGAILSAICFIILFSLPPAPVATIFVMVLIAYTASSTANALFAVPYLSLPVEMTRDAHERTRLMAFRMVFLLIGILLSGAAAPALVDHFGGGRAGYTGMAAIMAATFGAAKLAATLSTREGAAVKQKASHGVVEQMRLALRNREFLMLLGGFLMQSIAIGMFSAALPFYSEHRLGLGGAGVSVIFMSLAITGIIAMPVWSMTSKLIGKAQAYRLSAVIFALGAASYFFTPLALQSNSTVMLVLLSAVAGIGFGGLQLFSFALLPDLIQRDFELTGLRREAAYAGVWSALEKVALALGAMGAGSLLQAFGYAATDIHVEQQTSSSLFGILIAYSAAPALLTLLSLAPLWRLQAAPDGAAVRE